MRVEAASVAWADAARQVAFERWLASVGPRHGIDNAGLAPASADASFRRYLRVRSGDGSLIVMDAPPPFEDVRPFVHVAGLIQAAGLHAPRVLEVDEAQGFVLLEDLGNALYLDALRSAPPAELECLMRDALAALVRLQAGVPASALPPYGPAQIAAELALFPEWCVQREFGITWTATEHETWLRLCRLIADSALAQAVVAVHSDWMPRNLMVCPTGSGNPGILDFQDAVAGPITYDLASLLRDAFHGWPEEQELDWAVRWWQQARKAGLPVDEDFGEFWRALEWMGLQRHLRILGVFCRLKHRDGKARYAEDLPRFFGYATRVALRYPPLKPLLRLLEPMSGARVASGFTF
jgi:aminoglycoside/choline kinase family phosphotransferase